MKFPLELIALAIVLVWSPEIFPTRSSDPVATEYFILVASPADQKYIPSGDM